MNNKIEMKMKKNQLTMLVLFVTMLGFGKVNGDGDRFFVGYIYNIDV